MNKKGQALTEYLLVSVLISIASLGMIKLFTKYVTYIYREQITELGYELSGEQNIINLQKKLTLAQMKMSVIKEEYKSYSDRWKNK